MLKYLNFLSELILKITQCFQIISQFAANFGVISLYSDSGLTDNEVWDFLICISYQIHSIFRCQCGLTSNDALYFDDISVITFIFQGGPLVHCEVCPASYHASCLPVAPVSTTSWRCPDCSQGRRPLYNDLVWVKYSNYRCYDHSILSKIMMRLHCTNCSGVSSCEPNSK